MASAEAVKLDSKGRLLVPAGMRDFLRLKPDSEVLVSLDEENALLVVTPASEKRLTLLKIGLPDAPGSLAAIAKALADAGVDLVSTESRSVSRGRSAEWRVLCSIRPGKDVNEVKKRALKAGATSFQARRT